MKSSPSHNDEPIQHDVERINVCENLNRKLSAKWTVESVAEFESHIFSGRFVRFSDFMKTHFPIFWERRCIISLRKKLGVWGFHDDLAQNIREEIDADILKRIKELAKK